MRFINELKEGSRIQDVYLCTHKQSAVSKNGKTYENVVLRDRTGQIDAKIWDPNSEGIGEFEVFDYIYVTGSVSSFNGTLQASLRQVRKADSDEYSPSDYAPITDKNRKVMYQELTDLINSVKNEYYSALLKNFFLEDMDFVKAFYGHSAAKTVHHGFIGGLLEHTLSVTKLCAFMAEQYPFIDRDLLVTAALLHDIGKIHELSKFPTNDYTDAGQLLGHIMIGAEMIHDRAAKIPGFPAELELLLKHCILAHHGEFAFGSPKKPAIVEALALNLADNADAKLETIKEYIEKDTSGAQWIGFNKFLDSNIRRTDYSDGKAD